MTASIAASLYNAGYAQSIAQSLEKTRVDVLVLTPNQYMTILQDRCKNNPQLEFAVRKILGNSSFGQAWNNTFSANASEPWVTPVAQGASDLLMITKTLNALGMAGITTYVKTSGNKTYIMIKGYTAKRSSALQGTRYLATHPQMLLMGLGMKGLQGVAKGGFILGVVATSGIEVVDFIFNNEKTMYDLVGGVGVEAVKAGLAALVAYGAGAVIASVTTVAVLPLVVMAVVALAGGVLLNSVDSELKIKGQVTEALKAVSDQTAQGLYYINKRSQSWLEEIGDAVQRREVEMGRAIDQGFREWLCRIECRRY